MILEEETQIPLAALPIAAFRAHLRLGSGFGEDSLQDSVLEGFLRAALAAVEARTSKALIERGFRMNLREWRRPDSQALPVAPVSNITQIVLENATGDQDLLSADQYRLQRDRHAPEVRPVAAALPTVPDGGQINIQFVAGFGSDWSGVPVDLQQAVLLLAAHYYEHRHETALSGRCMPFGVTSLLERHRVFRMGASEGLRA